MSKSVKQRCERCDEPTANIPTGGRRWCKRCERRMAKQPAVKS